MHGKHLTMVLLTTLVACGGDGGGTSPPIDVPNATPPTEFTGQAFSLASLRAQRQQQNTGFLEFLSETSFRMGLYNVPVGPGDTEGGHGEDEIKYIVSGSAKFRIDGKDLDAEPGSAFFVKAGASHQFHSVTSELDVFVVFARGATGPTDPPVLAYTMDQMVAPRSASANIWNQFLTAQTMSLGMYMLPSVVGGDGSLTHAFDEINVVVSGRGRFFAGSDAIDIEPGSVFFVAQGVGHQFTAVSEDLDVLILWER